jgi:hypothetical protein
MRSEFVLLTGVLIMGASAGLSRCPAVAGIRPPGFFTSPGPAEGSRPYQDPSPWPSDLPCPTSTPPPPCQNVHPPENYCEKLMNARRSIYYLNTRIYKMSLQLRGIYTRGEAIFFCLRLYNHSHIDYAVDSIRFLMADEKQPGKARMGGASLSPLHHCGNAGFIKGKSGENCVFALPRFTLPAGKRLVIEIMEKNGGRKLRLFMDNYTLVRARLI